MNKSPLVIASVFLVIAAGVYLSRVELWEIAKDKLTADMFVESDSDSFDPGLAIGTAFPTIKVIYRGREISDVSQFVHDKGMVFIANRSADW